MIYKTIRLIDDETLDKTSGLGTATFGLAAIIPIILLFFFY